MNEEMESMESMESKVDRRDFLAMNHSSCLISDSWGIYIPQMFAESYGDDYLRANPEGQEDINILLEGPDHEYYWEAWDDILGNGEIQNEAGKTMWFYQEGDLFGWDDEEAMQEYFELL